MNQSNPEATLLRVSPSLIYKPASYLHPLSFAEMFPKAQPVELELGSGDGTFLATCASLHPDRNFIGIERLLGRLRKIDKKGLRAHLNNLRLLRIEAAYALEFLIAPQSLAALHVYFPDPWPKRRHRKNRLINERFPSLAARALQPGAHVFLRTDDQDYFTQMQRVFEQSALFKKIVETPPDLAAILTDFERDFRDKGIPCLRAAFQLRNCSQV